jgi:hypothetical protein
MITVMRPVNVNESDPDFFGAITNEINRVGARLVSSREQLANLRSKRFSMQTPAFRAEHVKAINQIVRLEAELPVLFGTFHGLRFRAREAERGALHHG